MSEPKMSAEERLRVHKRPAECFDMDWLVVDHDTAIRIAEAHAKAAVDEVTRAWDNTRSLLRNLEDEYVVLERERDDTLARVAELEAEVERLRVLRPFAKTLAPTIMMCVKRALSLAELKHAVDLEMVLDVQMRTLVVSLASVLAPQAPKEVQP